MHYRCLLKDTLFEKNGNKILQLQVSLLYYWKNEMAQIRKLIQLQSKLRTDLKHASSTPSNNVTS